MFDILLPFSLSPLLLLSTVNNALDTCCKDATCAGFSYETSQQSGAQSISFSRSLCLSHRSHDTLVACFTAAIRFTNNRRAVATMEGRSRALCAAVFSHRASNPYRVAPLLPPFCRLLQAGYQLRHSVERRLRRVSHFSSSSIKN